MRLRILNFFVLKMVIFRCICVGTEENNDNFLNKRLTTSHNLFNLIISTRKLKERE